LKRALEVQSNDIKCDNNQFKSRDQYNIVLLFNFIEIEDEIELKADTNTTAVHRTMKCQVFIFVAYKQPFCVSLKNIRSDKIKKIVFPVKLLAIPVGKIGKKV